MRYRLLGRIALGNSDNGLVEGYATVEKSIPFSYSDISKYEEQHRATEFLKIHYKGRDVLYGFVLGNLKLEETPFPYPKSRSITFDWMQNRRY